MHERDVARLHDARLEPLPATALNHCPVGLTVHRGFESLPLR